MRKSEYYCVFVAMISICPYIVVLPIIFGISVVWSLQPLVDIIMIFIVVLIMVNELKITGGLELIKEERENWKGGFQCL